MSDTSNALAIHQKTIGERIWAAGDAVGGVLAGCAGYAVPLVIAGLAALAVTNGFGVQAPELIKGVAFAGTAATSLMIIPSAVMAGAAAFKRNGERQFSMFKQELLEGGRVGSMIAAASGVALGLTCVCSYLCATLTQFHGIGALVAVPVFAVAAGLQLTAMLGGMCNLTKTMDRVIRGEKTDRPSKTEPAAVEPAPALALAQSARGEPHATLKVKERLSERRIREQAGKIAAHPLAAPGAPKTA